MFFDRPRSPLLLCQRQQERRSAQKRSRKRRGLFWLMLLPLGVLGWFCFFPHSPVVVPSLALSSQASSASMRERGLGAGGAGGSGERSSFGGPLLPATRTLPPLCDPLDPSCYASTLAQYAAGQIISAFQPLTNFFQNSSANIITQTPVKDSYGNTTIVALNGVFVDAVDAALACLLLLGGYNVMVGQHLRLPQSSITELLPRAILVAFAVHFNLLFLGLFVDLENALCATVTAATSYQTFTNIITSFLSLSPTAGLLLVVLILVFFVLALLLLFQMTTRIALVAVLISVAPLGLACFMLPQTVRWGRLWLTTFSSAILVQFVQVTALGLGAMFLTSLGATAFWHVGQQLGTIFLATGTLFLVLKIPGMLQTWALHPMMETPDWGGGGGNSAGDSVGGGGAGDAANGNVSGGASESGSFAGTSTGTSAGGGAGATMTASSSAPAAQTAASTVFLV